MNSILLYIEPEESQRQQMIQMAADLVEALTFQVGEAVLPPRSIGVIAEPSTCLEIGLSMLGRGETRTVEGGERRASPLMLFPFVSDGSQASGEVALLRRGESAPDDFGTLDDLAAFGAVEQDPEATFAEQDMRSASEVLERILRRRSWQTIVVFGPDELAPESIRSRAQTSAWIVNAEHLNVDSERIPGLLERLEPTDDEETRRVRRAAVSGALQLEALLSRLESLY